MPRPHPKNPAAIVSRALERVEPIGKGGTAIVYAAGPQWAVKVPHRHKRLFYKSAADVDALWQREADTAQTFAWSPIVPVTMLSRTPDGLPALVVERVTPLGPEEKVTAREFAALESAYDLLVAAGWRCRDELQVGRKARGRLMLYDLGECGIWTNHPGHPGEMLDAWSSWHADPWAESLTTLRVMLASGHPHLAAAIARRKRAGLPVPI